MIPSFKFGRLDKSTNMSSFVYNIHNDKDAVWEQRDIDLNGLGSHLSVTIRNYMREPLYTLDGLRTEPKKHESIYASDSYMLSESTNMVSVDIRHRDNERDKDGRVKIRTQRRVEINFPGHILQSNSVYVEELGSYLTIASRITATRELIAKNNHFGKTDHTTVSESMMRPNPVNMFRKYEPLIRNCIDRIDRIQVRVGHRIDVDPISVPDKIKNMRIAVLDNYFSPYGCGKMVYDPQLLDDEFVVENIHLISSEELISTFQRLNDAEGRGFFLDLQEHETMHGSLLGLAIFADTSALTDYLFIHKSEAAYEELMQYAALKDGSPVLKKTIERLESELGDKQKTIDENEAMLKHERNQVRDLKRMVSAHEETINKIFKNTEASMSYDAVMADIAIAQDKLTVERDKLKFERQELEAKLKMAKQNQSVGIMKSIGDILKSGWAIATVLITIGTAIFKYWNKLNPSIT